MNQGTLVVQEEQEQCALREAHDRFERSLEKPRLEKKAQIVQGGIVIPFVEIHYIHND